MSLVAQPCLTEEDGQGNEADQGIDRGQRSDWDNDVESIFAGTLDAAVHTWGLSFFRISFHTCARLGSSRM